MINSVDVSIGVNKIILKCIGPCVIYKVLSNNIFIVKDIQGFQHIRVQYKGHISVDNLKC